MSITVITCSGVSNTGKLTTQTGTMLIRRCAGKIETCIGATRPGSLLEDTLMYATNILVLDGCADCCGMKKVQALGIKPHVHIIATECGIEKKGMADPEFAEIERLTAVVMEVIHR